MAKAPGRIQVDVVLSPSSLANSLRDLADKIAPQPPTATAEDLRGAEAEIDRLRDILAGFPTLTDDATVERVARVIHDHNCGGRTRCWNRDTHWQVWQKDARAVLAAIGGE